MEKCSSCGSSVIKFKCITCGRAFNIKNDTHAAELLFLEALDIINPSNKDDFKMCDRGSDEMLFI
jgi:hypothetical protein